MRMMRWLGAFPCRPAGGCEGNSSFAGRAVTARGAREDPRGKGCGRRLGLDGESRAGALCPEMSARVHARRFGSADGARPLNRRRGRRGISGRHAPGEWFYDVTRRRICYRPLPGETLARLDACAPSSGLPSVVRLEGDLDAGRFVTDIAFVGISFGLSTTEGRRLRCDAARPEEGRERMNVRRSLFPALPRHSASVFRSVFGPFFASKIALFSPQNTPLSCGWRSAAANISPILPFRAEIVRIRSFIGSKWRVVRKRLPHEV